MSESPIPTATATSPTTADIGPHRAHLNKLRQRLGSFMRKCHRLFPLTWSGVFTLAAGVIGWCTLGSRHRDLVISSASFILGLLVIILLVSVLITALRLYLALRRDDLNIEALKLESGYPRLTDFKIELNYFPFTEITWSWAYPVQTEVTTKSTLTSINETVTAHHRCQADHITRHFIVKDVLGLARIEWEHTFDTPITVIPCLEKFSTNQVLPSVSDGDEDSNPYGAPKGDRIEMRKYTQGDSSRDIIWKIYARSRKLMVRVPECAITAQPRSCAYLVAGYGDEISASLARTILERHMLGDNWGFGADGTPGLITTLGPAIQAIARSGNYELISSSEAKTTGLANYLKEAAARGYNNCLIFIPSSLTKPAPPLLSRWQRLFTPEEKPWPEWVNVARSALHGNHMTITWLMGVAQAPAQLAPQNRSDEPAWKEKLRQFAVDSSEQVPDTALEVTKVLVSDQTPVWLYESSKCHFLVYNHVNDVSAR